MPGRRLSGLTVVIGGDTTKLNKALEGTNKQLKSSQQQLKDVERLLKLDPKNTELLAQKQRLLGDEITATSKKLETLKAANEKAGKALSNNAEYQKRYEPLKQQIDETKVKLDELKKKDQEAKQQLEAGQISKEKYDTLQQELKKTETEYDNLKQAAKDLEAEFSEGHINQEQYDALQREIAETENSLKSLEQQAGQSNVKLEKVAATTKQFGDKMVGAGKKMLPVSGAIVGVGTASAVMATNFDDSVAQINTLLDDDSHLQGYKDAIVEISDDTNQSLDSMSQGMYQAISSIGDGGKETEKIFNTMARSAKAGGAEVSDSVSLISAGMKGYNQVNDETAQRISDLAFQTAKLGVTTFPEMAKSMQPLFPLSNSLKMSYEELFGVMATGTGVTGNTAEVSTQFKAVMSNLMKPTGEMTKLIEKYGYANGAAMIESEGLSGVLSILRTETGGQSDQLAKLFSSTEALTLMTALTGSQFDTFNEKLGAMGGAAGATGKAYDKMQTDGEKARASINRLKNAMVRLGESIMAALGPSIEKVSNIISDFSKWFSKLDDGTKGMIVTVGLIIAAIGPFLIFIGKISLGISALSTGITKIGPTLKTIGTGFKALWGVLAANPIVLIIAAIVGLVAGFIYLWNKSEAFRNFWIGLWNGIKSAVMAVVNGIKAFLMAAFMIIMNNIKMTLGVIKSIVYTIITAIKTQIQIVMIVMQTIIRTILTTIKAIFQAVFGTIKIIVRTVFNVIRTIIQTVMGVIKGIIKTVTSIIKGDWKGAWEGVKQIVKSLFGGVIGIIQNIINGIGDIFHNIINTAITWGKDMIQGIIDGIKSMIGKVGDAVGGVADKITSFLHFSRPDTGPLREYEKWMPDFMSGMADGIRKNTWRVLDQVQGLAKKMKVGVNANMQMGQLSAASASGSVINLTVVSETNIDSKPLAKHTAQKVINIASRDMKNHLAGKGRR